MASEQECADALQRLARRLDASAETSGASPAAGYTRTLSCTLRDLGVVFAARLHGGRLSDLRTVAARDAQIRLEMTSDDLLSLVDGTLAFPRAWATGRVSIHAGVRDLLRLRTMF